MICFVAVLKRSCSYLSTHASLCNAKKAARAIPPKAMSQEIKEEIEYQQISEFLESTPPNQRIHLSDLVTVTQTTYGKYIYNVRTPEIQLHCEHENCNGIRFFRCKSEKENYIDINGYNFFYVTYICSNCQKVEKTFSELGEKKNDISMRKIAFDAFNKHLEEGN